MVRRLDPLPTLFALIVLGFSQRSLITIQNNQLHYPPERSFHVWVLIWILFLPLLPIWGIDHLLGRKGRCRASFRIWRGLLYGLTTLSFIRQYVTSSMATPPSALFGSVGAVFFYLAPAAILFCLGWKFGPAIHRFWSWMSLVALWTVLSYAGSTCFWKATWGGEDTVGRPDSPGRDPKPAEARPPVLLIVFDELSHEVLAGPDGVPDSSRFPAFADLADDSVLFPRAFTNDAFTEQSIPVMLSGKLQPSSARGSLFDRLPAGYEVHAIEPFLPGNPVLDVGMHLSTPVEFHGRNLRRSRSPLETARVLAMLLLDPPFVPDRVHRAVWVMLGKSGGFHSGTFAEAELLDSALQGGRLDSRVWYWHCTFPHPPFAHAADGTLDARPGWGFPRGREDHPEIWEKYQAQMMLADRLLGRVIARLKTEGLYDRSILVVTSDHGIRTWGSREPEGYPRMLSNLTPRVPLLIRAPSIVPKVSQVEYQHIDLAPTILDLLGVRYDGKDFDGVSAFNLQRPIRRRVFRGTKGLRFEFDPSRNLWVAQDP